MHIKTSTFTRENPSNHLKRVGHFKTLEEYTGYFFDIGSLIQDNSITHRLAGIPGTLKKLRPPG